MIVAAIALPRLARARMWANEASAIGSMRALNTAQLGVGLCVLAAAVLTFDALRAGRATVHQIKHSHVD